MKDIRDNVDDDVVAVDDNDYDDVVDDEIDDDRSYGDDNLRFAGNI